jgi:hypothetical protein
MIMTPHILNLLVIVQMQVCILYLRFNSHSTRLVKICVSSFIALALANLGTTLAITGPLRDVALGILTLASVGLMAYLYLAVRNEGGKPAPGFDKEPDA